MNRLLTITAIAMAIVASFIFTSCPQNKQGKPPLPIEVSNPSKLFSNGYECIIENNASQEMQLTVSVTRVGRTIYNDSIILPSNSQKNIKGPGHRSAFIGLLDEKPSDINGFQVGDVVTIEHPQFLPVKHSIRYTMMDFSVEMGDVVKNAWADITKDPEGGITKVVVTILIGLSELIWNSPLWIRAAICFVLSAQIIHLIYKGSSPSTKPPVSSTHNFRLFWLRIAAALIDLLILEILAFLSLLVTEASLLSFLCVWLIFSTLWYGMSRLTGSSPGKCIAGTVTKYEKLKLTGVTIERTPRMLLRFAVIWMPILAMQLLWSASAYDPTKVLHFIWLCLFWYSAVIIGMAVTKGEGGLQDELCDSYTVAAKHPPHTTERKLVICSLCLLFVAMRLLVTYNTDREWKETNHASSCGAR